MKTSLLFSILSIVITNSFCQNLVLNPSFEEVDYTIESEIPFEKVKYWTPRPKYGSRYLNTADCDGNLEECNNINKSKTGNACAELTFFTRSGGRTYGTNHLIGFLREPLQKGKIYELEFYYKLADSANIMLHNISLSLTPKPLQRYDNLHSLASKPWLITQSKHYPKNSKSWQQFSYQYIARGGERVIGIGYMGIIDNINHVKYDLRDKDFWKKHNITNPDLTHANYKLNASYYIDDISVTEIKLIDDLGRISSIYFENNSFTLSASSQEKLNQLFKLKAANLSNYNIVVEGFADKKGDESDNDALSQKRAKSVADYLINKGMPTHRIEIKAYGESLAKGVDNTSDRRVDIYLRENIKKTSSN